MSQFIVCETASSSSRESGELILATPRKVNANKILMAGTTKLPKPTNTNPKFLLVL
jgi:hypothetical protein